MEYIIGFFVLLLAIVILVQFQIRKQYHFPSNLDPETALQAAARGAGGGSSFIDAAGQLSVPYRNGIMSVAAEPTPEGSMVHVWLSEYPFWGANGFQVMGYQRAVKRVRRSVGAG